MTTYPTKENCRETGAIIKVSNAGKKYPLVKGIHAGIQDLWALKGISLEVARGKILGIIGRNGAGKTTFLNMVAGVLSPTEGEIWVSGRVLGLFNLGVGFQDELTGKENIFLNGALLGASKAELETKQSAIIDFSELGGFVDMPLGTYSQGMRLRLAFSIVANLDFDILVIDEILAVGDALFQSKCFERLMDFKRAGKTLIITAQNMELIERLCDQSMLLDHGRLLFLGAPAETISKYRALINTERFYVGPSRGSRGIFENTKKWADDISEWGKELGTRETLITSVDFINRWSFQCQAVKSCQPLKVRVCFRVRNVIKEPHFGIAIFRADGVYVYGPNTLLDGQVINEIKPGKGWFELHYAGLWLAPGNYKISVAIWDKHETLPFDYYSGFYDFKISGALYEGNELLNIPCKVNRRTGKIRTCIPVLAKGNNPVVTESDEHGKITIDSVQWTDAGGAPKDIFRTQDPAHLRVCVGGAAGFGKDVYIWAGLFRQDDVFCQGFSAPLMEDRSLAVFFPELPLLPGGYNVSVGVWDQGVGKFLAFRRDAAAFRMIFDQGDHGTVFLKHRWQWKVS